MVRTSRLQERAASDASVTPNIPSTGRPADQATLDAYDTLLNELLPGGDFNGDGFTDGRDFLAWQRDPGIGDLATWQAEYNSSGLNSSATTVPEPATWILLTLTLASVSLTRPNRRLG